MSYLNFTRLHFAGQFQADVSTVNNDPYHFDNQAFVPEDQQLQSGNNYNGWWNPGGTGYWRLKNVVVTSACYADGQVITAPSHDPVIGTPIAGADDRVAAKIVDLDSQNQQVSELWGFQVNVGNLAGGNAFSANYKVAPFDDLWFARVPSHPGDSGASAYYQSILNDIEWSQYLNSPILLALKEAATTNGNRLSIRFTVDGFNGDYNTENFGYGRIVGEIGIYNEGEPKHFVNGRYLRPLPDAPIALYYAPAKVISQETAQELLFVDLSNSLPAQSAGGAWVDVGNLQLAVQRQNGSYLLLGAVEYQQPDWYTQRGGIETYTLTGEASTLVNERPLAVVRVTNDGVIIPLLQENAIGGLARTDYFVYRLDPQTPNSPHVHYWPQQAELDFYALQFGQPARNKTFQLTYDNAIVGGYVQQIPTSPAGPPVGTPEAALQFPSTITTDEHGKASITLSCSNPGNPRGYIDGQVYGVVAIWPDISGKTYQQIFNPNPWQLISVRVFDAFQTWVPDKPVWRTDLQPIFQQYANLYPIMKSVLDLGDYESVVTHRGPLKRVFSAPVHNPNYMPVTRDLSNGKKAAMLDWLAQEPSPYYWLPPIETKVQLQQALQYAIELEHATIPTYLAAYLSIKPGENPEVAEIIHSVVVQEMLHMTLACNMLNAISGSPAIDRPNFIPKFPGPLPYGLRPDLTVTLKKCSLEHIKNVFMQIEEPEETRGGVKHTMTIGWFYDQIASAFEELDRCGNLFTGDPNQQVKRWGKENISVHNLPSALKAIDTIKEQGEGISANNPLDEDRELAHYYKFSEIVHGHHIVVNRKTHSYSYTGAKIPFNPEGVYNMVDNPNTNNLPENSFVREKSEHFDRAYTNLLRTLHTVFNGKPEKIHDAVGLMFSLTTLAHQLLLLPVSEDSDQMAGPSFLYRP